MLHLVTIMGGDKSNPDIVDHFINHYTKIGVTEFHIYVHNNEAFVDRLEKIGIKPTGILNQFNEGLKESLFNQTIDKIGNQWCLTCDQDEFQSYTCPFSEIKLNDTYDHVFGYLVDRFADKWFPKLKENIPISEQFPKKSIKFTRNILLALNIKTLAVRGVHIKTGHHTCYGKKGFGPIPIDHYKWDASVLERLTLERGNHYSNKEASIFKNLVDRGIVQEVIDRSII